MLYPLIHLPSPYRLVQTYLKSVLESPCLVNTCAATTSSTLEKILNFAIELGLKMNYLCLVIILSRNFYSKCGFYGTLIFVI